MHPVYYILGMLKGEGTQRKHTCGDTHHTVKFRGQAKANSGLHKLTRLCRWSTQVDTASRVDGLHRNWLTMSVSTGSMKGQASRCRCRR